MAKQVIVQGKFMDILMKAVDEEITARLDFIGNDMGVVRVFLVDGSIYHIDSTWGVGRNELRRLKDWEYGKCVIKQLSEDEISRLKEGNIIITPGEVMGMLE